MAYAMLIVFLVLGGTSILSWKRYAERQSDLPKIARNAGLSYSEGDPFDIPRLARRSMSHRARPRARCCSRAT